MVVVVMVVRMSTYLKWVVVLQVLQLQVQQVVLVLLRHHVVQFPRRLLEQVVEANDQYVVE